MGTRWDYVNPPVFPTLEQRGTESMRSLLNTVYHLAGAMYHGSDVGFGAHIDRKLINTTTWREEFRFGSFNGYQTNTGTIGAGKLATYPCEGSSNIPPAFAPATETPNPFPTFTSTSQTVGPPIYLKVDAGQVLAVTSSSVSRNSVNVPITVLTHANDPNTDSFGQRYIDPNEAFVVPDVALEPNTIYQVNLSGTINSVPFSRNFTMSTGQ